MAKCECPCGPDSATIAHIHDRFVNLRRGRLVGHIRYHHRHPGPSQSAEWTRARKCHFPDPLQLIGLLRGEGFPPDGQQLVVARCHRPRDGLSSFGVDRRCCHYGNYTRVRTGRSELLVPACHLTLDVDAESRTPGNESGRLHLGGSLLRPT